MWRFISTVTAIFSAIGVIYLWRRFLHHEEDDHYYHYGDSMYRGDLSEPISKKSPTWEEEPEQTMEGQGNENTMIH